jgi:hypothetical protein
VTASAVAVGTVANQAGGLQPLPGTVAAQTGALQPLPGTVAAQTGALQPLPTAAGGAPSAGFTPIATASPAPGAPNRFSNSTGLAAIPTIGVNSAVASGVVAGTNLGLASLQPLNTAASGSLQALPTGTSGTGNTGTGAGTGAGTGTDSTGTGSNGLQPLPGSGTNSNGLQSLPVNGANPTASLSPLGGNGNNPNNQFNAGGLATATTSAFGGLNTGAADLSAQTTGFNPSQNAGGRSSPALVGGFAGILVALLL